MALHEREDEAVRRLTAIVERDERDFHQAAMESVADLSSAEHRYTKQMQKISILAGTFGGTAAPYYVGMGYHYLGGVLPCLSVIMLTTLICTASGAAIGRWVAR